MYLVPVIPDRSECVERTSLMPRSGRMSSSLYCWDKEDLSRWSSYIILRIGKRKETVTGTYAQSTQLMSEGQHSITALLLERNPPSTHA